MVEGDMQHQRASRKKAWPCREVIQTLRFMPCMKFPVTASHTQTRSLSLSVSLCLTLSLSLARSLSLSLCLCFLYRLYPPFAGLM